MRIPGFSAEASTFRSTVHYYSGAALGEVSGSYANPAQTMLLPALPIEGGGRCRPWVGECVPDKTCASGRSQHAVTWDCNLIKDCTCSLGYDGGSGGGGGGTGGGTNCDLCKAGNAAWFVACEVDTSVALGAALTAIAGPAGPVLAATAKALASLFGVDPCKYILGQLNANCPC